MTTQTMLPAALDLAAAGWEVLPLAGKIPRTEHGVDDATSDLDTVAGWWQRWPSANIGARVPRDFVVIDVDPRNGGGETLVALVDRLGPLPLTLTAVSGRGDGGHHRYFLRPVGAALKARPAAGIDVKTSGYMVMPPSVHPETGRRYEWIDREPVALPSAWLGFLRVEPPRARPVIRRADDHDGDGLVRWVADLHPGNRNNGLFWAACKAADLGVLDVLEADLVAAAMAAGLPELEVRTVLRSAKRRVAA